MNMCEIFKEKKTIGKHSNCFWVLETLRRDFLRKQDSPSIVVSIDSSVVLLPS
jgi:hypothetical protein